MFRQREFHDLHTGDSFSFEQGGPVYRVDDGDFLDEEAGRLIMYRTDDGIHGHHASHEVVWVFTD